MPGNEAVRGLTADSCGAYRDGEAACRRLLECVLTAEREYYLALIQQTGGGKELCAWLTERFCEVGQGQQTGKQEHKNRLVTKAQEYMERNFRRDLSLEEVSRQLDLSSYYFSRLFKEETGSSFVEYLTGLRMDQARRLLTAERCSMKAVCREVGYSDPNYFSRIFKKHTGVTPTEYREAKICRK